MPPRFAITSAEIDQVVRHFYAALRRHPVLAPIFAAHVTQWPAHEEKIASFWRNAILGERIYDGNPMRKHLEAGNVAPAHFALWLDLFDQVLAQELSPEVARQWSALAHRIGAGLRSGILVQQGRLSGVPDLS